MFSGSSCGLCRHFYCHKAQQQMCKHTVRWAAILVESPFLVLAVELEAVFRDLL